MDPLPFQAFNGLPHSRLPGTDPSSRVARILATGDRRNSPFWAINPALSRSVDRSAWFCLDDGASDSHRLLPWLVRDVSSLGARHGHRSAVRTNHAENDGRPWVRSHCQLGCESSKRIQTGEPNSIAFIPVGPRLTKELTRLYSGSNPRWGMSGNTAAFRFSSDRQFHRHRGMSRYESAEPPMCSTTVAGGLA